LNTDELGDEPALLDRVSLRARQPVDWERASANRNGRRVKVGDNPESRGEVWGLEDEDLYETGRRYPGSAVAMNTFGLQLAEVSL
jgi:hypothetical protein